MSQNALRRRRRLPEVAQPEAPESVLNCDDYLRLLMLRILVPLGGAREFITKRGFSEDGLASFLGLDEFLRTGNADDRLFDDDALSAFRPAKALRSLRVLHAEAESHAGQHGFPAQLIRNVAKLGEMLNLGESEQRILAFAVLIKTESLLHECAETLGPKTPMLRLCRILGLLLDLDENAVKQALDPRGRLAQTGMLSVNVNNFTDLDEKLELLSNDFADSMLGSVIDTLELFRGRLMRSGVAHLGLSDFEHIRTDLELVRPLLRNASLSGRIGTNVLVYGPPGTGKTQLARVLAQDLQIALYEVPCEDADGDPINAINRLRALRAGMAVLDNSQSLLLFDEIEDVFGSSDDLVGRSAAQSRKAWINRTLESNPIPTIWLSNKIAMMDPAFIRRFDMLIEMPIPPASARRRIITGTTAGLLPPESIERLVCSEHLAPANVTRAASVIQCIGDAIPLTEAPAALEHIISRTLQAQGHDGLRKGDANRLPEHYDPAFINTSENLQALAEGLRATGSGRICLYGPPGTGKTAFGRWLATYLEKPLHVRRASDILSMWVGGNEQNLAKVFREAEEEGALLLIDEVDSFLQDRRQAHASWETTCVNEMLTQMECFGGIFIASTNLIDGLDPASLRRFDLKLKFDYLRADQAWSLFEKHCYAAGLGQPDIALRERLQRLAKLTPGDFAAVARQCRFMPHESTASFVKNLEGECELKSGSGAGRIGFV